MNKSSLAVIAIVALIVFLVVAVVFGGGWGMMGPWMMGLGMMWGFGPFGWIVMLSMWLLPALVVILLILLLIGWLGGTTPTIGQTCSHCGRAVKSNWVSCPHCGTSL
ncbi:MAG: zinc ribbon domain-containing protein [Microgenomates group bacterium]